MSFKKIKLKKSHVKVMFARIKEKKKRKLAFIFSIFLPGLGQILRKRIIAGLFFITMFLFFIFFHRFLYFLRPDLSALINLLFFVLYFILWLFSIVDAYRGPIFSTSPCTKRCPLNLDVPAYLAFIAQDDFDFADGIIREKTPFVGSLGRICYRPCEDVCTRVRFDSAIAIKVEKRAASDYSPNEEIELQVLRRNRKIAIIGAGPAGLTAAYYLAIEGFDVDVYDRDEPGGMLYHSIPDFRLPKEVVEEEISWIRKTGINIIKKEVGKDVEFSKIVKNYDAVFIAIGLSEERKLRIKGDDKEGVYYGLSFLRNMKMNKFFKLGRRVAVIGGGNVAIDVARTAIRQGAKVKVFYRRREQDMPVHSIEYSLALEEGIEFLFLSYPLEIIGEKRVEKIRFAKTRLKDEEKGRESEIIITDEQWEEEFDSVIIAVGQEPGITGFGGVELTSDGRIKVDRFLRTSLKNVFAGGDIVRGPSTVVEASADGRKAAEIIKLYTERKPLWILPFIKFFKFEWDVGKNKKIVQMERVQIKTLPKNQRLHSFKEVEFGYTKEEAMKEAGRCLKCGFHHEKIR